MIAPSSCPSNLIVPSAHVYAHALLACCLAFGIGVLSAAGVAQTTAETRRAFPGAEGWAAQTPGGRLVYSAIEHDPWPLQPARAEIKDLNMTAWMGLELPRVPPLLHYADVVHVHGGPPTWIR